MATEARWKGRLIASSDSTISVDGNAYFPAAALVENCFFHIFWTFFQDFDSKMMKNECFSG